MNAERRLALKYKVLSGILLPLALSCGPQIGKSTRNLTPASEDNPSTEKNSLASEPTNNSAAEQNPKLKMQNQNLFPFGGRVTKENKDVIQKYFHDLPDVTITKDEQMSFEEGRKALSDAQKKGFEEHKKDGDPFDIEESLKSTFKKPVAEKPQSETAPSTSTQPTSSPSQSSPTPITSPTSSSTTSTNSPTPAPVASPTSPSTTATNSQPPANATTGTSPEATSSTAPSQNPEIDESLQIDDQYKVIVVENKREKPPKGTINDDPKKGNPSPSTQPIENQNPLQLLTNIFCGKNNQTCLPNLGNSIDQVIGYYAFPNRYTKMESRLINGTEIPADGKSFHQKSSSRNARWGSEHTLYFLNNLSDKIVKTQLSSLLVVGDVSKKGGGYLTPHLSHQNGLDVDLGFLAADGINIEKEIFPDDFVNRRNNTLTKKFDIQKNWQMIRMAVESNWTYMIVTHPSVKKAFCQMVKKSGKLQEFSNILGQIIPDETHFDHFHLRLKCPATSPRCVIGPDLPAESRCDEV